MGMGAWMRAWSLCTQGVEDAAISSTSERLTDGDHDLAPLRFEELTVEGRYIAAGVREQITSILAEIILGHSRSAAEP